jgi:hypothetical protein
LKGCPKERNHAHGEKSSQVINFPTKLNYYAS